MHAASRRCPSSVCATHTKGGRLAWNGRHAIWQLHACAEWLHAWHLFMRVSSIPMDARAHAWMHAGISMPAPMLTGVAILIRSARLRVLLTGVGVWLLLTLRCSLAICSRLSVTQMSGVASSSTAASSLASCRLMPSERSGRRHSRAMSLRALGGRCSRACWTPEDEEPWCL